MPPLELIGVRAVVENINNYIRDLGKTQVAADKAAAAQLRLERTTQSINARAQASQRAIAKATLAASITRSSSARSVEAAEKRLATTVDSTARSIARAEQRVADAKDRVAKNAKASAARQESAAKALANAEIALDDRRVASAARVAAARASLANTKASAVARTTVADVGVVSTTAAGGATAAANTLALRSAQEAAAKSGVSLARGITVATVATSAFSKAQQIATNVTTTFGKALIAVTGFGNRFAVAMRFGAAAAAGFAAALSISTASDFQDSLSKINVLTDSTTQETEQLGKEILELTKIVPKSPNELGSAAYFLLSLNILKASEAAEALIVISKASTAGLGSVIDVARTVAGTIAAYGKENITAAQATDILFAAVKLGGAEASEFAQDIGRVLPISAQLGITFDEVAAAIATLTKIIPSASQATTAFLGIINQIFSPDAGAEKLLDQIYGIDNAAAQLRDTIRSRGLAAAMQDLLEKASRNREVFAKLFPEVRGLTGSLVLANGEFLSFSETLEGVRNSGGIVEDAFQKVRNNFSVVVGILKGTLNRALIELGTNALPQVTKAAADLNDWLEKNRESIQDFIVRGVAVSISILKDFFAGIIFVVGTLSKLNDAFKSLTGIAPATAAAVGLIGLAFAWALPGGPIFVGLAALITLLGSLQKKSTETQLKVLAATAAGAVVGGVLGSIVAPGVGTVAGASAGGLAGGHLFNKLFGEDGAQKANELSDAQKLLIETEKLAKEQTAFFRHELEKLLPQLNEGGNAAADAAKKLEELKEAFRSSAESARETAGVFSGLNLFGNISQELAKALNISPIVAGNIQGLDAVAAASSRASSEAFNLASALATVAAAFSQSAAVASSIVLKLAQSALSAAQQAAAALFSRPTREVANLRVKLAQVQLQNVARDNSSSENAQKNIDKQTKQIQDQIKSVQKQNQNAAKAAAEANKQRQIADRVSDVLFRQSIEAARRAARAQLDQLRFQHLLEQHAFERMIEGIERLIDANNKSRSDLQEAFLKSNESLQRQINEAIGRGDADTALSLVKQQRDQAKAYQEQDVALRKNGEQLTANQKRLELENREAQRRRQIEEELVQRMVDRSLAEIEAMESSRQLSEAFESNIEASESSTEALEAQLEQLSAQSEAITATNEKMGEQEEAIQKSIEQEEAKTALLQAQVEAADATLLTYQEQAKAANTLIGVIREESGIVRALSQQLGLSLIPGFDDVIKQSETLQIMMGILTNDSIRGQFIEQGLEPATKFLELLSKKEEQAARGADKLADSTEKAANKIAGSAQLLAAKVAQSVIDITNAVRSIPKPAPAPSPSPSPKPTPSPGGTPSPGQGSGSFNAEGGIYSFPTTTRIAEQFKPEIVLPLTKPARIQELLSQLPTSLSNRITAYGRAPAHDRNEKLAGLLASIPAMLLANMHSARQEPLAVFSPNIVVHGETLEGMRALAIRAVNQAFRDAEVQARRGGGRINSGLGPAA